MRRIIFPALFALLAACSSDSSNSNEPTIDSVQEVAGTHANFDISADLSTADGFYAMPYPSDLRLLNGAPDVRGWPNPQQLSLIEGLRAIVPDRKGFPVIPAGYFQFSAPLPALDIKTVMPADKSSPVLLIDIDPSSPELGRIVPTVATVPPPDDYVPENLLAVAARPGVILRPNRLYAFVVQRSLKDAEGAPLGSSRTFEQLKAGFAPEGEHGEHLRALYEPLWPALKNLGIGLDAVAAATVFTTGDVVKDTAEVSSRVLAQHAVEITDLVVDPDDGADHPSYCEIKAKVVYPQFQRGKPPFNTEGTFDFGGGDTPIKQRDEVAEVVLSLPKSPMPKGGYPLTVYFHGSGGLPAAIADRGTWHPETDPTKCPEGTTDTFNNVTGCNTKGGGPASILGPHGIGMAATDMPVNPTRLPGAEETAYLNFANLAAFRDTFRQGVIEQRLFIDALSRLSIPPEVVAKCEGLSLPEGETAYHYSFERLTAQGQSMGGMYTNMIGSVEPKIQAVVPTGAGGYWSYFILETSLIPKAAEKVALLLGTREKLSFVHPSLHLLQTAWETSDPIVYMPRLAYNPLEGHPTRSIYEPAGEGDSYFPTTVYDSVALAYNHKQAGQEVWSTMQQALKLMGLDGIMPYPLTNNLSSLSGKQYTAAVIQYEGDGVYDPHALYTQRDEVKYQYGCFLSSFMKTGNATIFAPKPLGSPCE